MHYNVLITLLLGLSGRATFALPSGNSEHGEIVNRYDDPKSSSTNVPDHGELNRRYNHAPYPGQDKVSKWVALGDSFSAGPGAGPDAPGDEAQCRRRLGAYPPQLAASPVFHDPNAYGDPHLDFRSCTGNEVPQVQNEQVSYIKKDTDLITLSIGGNDIKFTDILTACVVLRTGDCDAAIAKARNILYETSDFHSNWVQLIFTIYKNSDWQNRGNGVPEDRKTLLYQTSYPPFFESWTTQCNGVRFLPGLGVLLTTDLRDKLNVLGQELNAVLAHWIDQVNSVYSGRNIGLTPSANYPWFMKFSNQDEWYNKHRFCREDVTEPDRNNDQTWFFNLFSNRDGGQSEGTVTSANFATTWKVDPQTCSLTAGQGEFADTLPCAISKAIADGNTDDQTVWPSTPEAIQKTFHPRTPGFFSTSENIQYDLLYEPAGESGSTLENRHLRIMGIGDSLAAGISDLDYVSGYRETLYKLLTSEPSNKIEFVGTQSQGPPPYQSMEGYFTGGVNDFLARLRQNQALQKLQPNIIILTAGSSDLRGIDPNDYNGLQRLRTDLSTLIDYIFTTCSGCAVLLGDIPPPPRPFQWPPSPEAKQAFQFNAMISEIVNQQATQNNRHITKLHFSVPTDQILSANGNPTRLAYDYMAYDINERLEQLSIRQWIQPPGVGGNSASASPTLAPTPLSLSAAPGVPTIGASDTPHPTNPTSVTTTSSATCDGNQVTGACTPAILPSVAPDSGAQAPACNKVGGPSNDYLMFNADKAGQQAADYCSNLISGKVVLSDSTSPPKPGYVANAATGGGYVALTVLFDVGSCDSGTDAANQKLDFSTWTQDQCYQNLYTTLSQVCAVDSQTPGYDPQNTLQGGAWAGSCAIWAMEGLPGSPPG